MRVPHERIERHLVLSKITYWEGILGMPLSVHGLELNYPEAHGGTWEHRIGKGCFAASLLPPWSPLPIPRSRLFAFDDELEPLRYAVHTICLADWDRIQRRTRVMKL